MQHGEFAAATRILSRGYRERQRENDDEDETWRRVVCGVERAEAVVFAAAKDVSGAAVTGNLVSINGGRPAVYHALQELHFTHPAEDDEAVGWLACEQRSPC
eukprot:1570873-Rhodomonas_salina.1